MAQGGITPGETTFGTPQTRGIVGHAAQQTATNLPGLIHLQTWNGTTLFDWYIWVDASGNLRGLSSIPVNQATDGVVISATPIL